MSSPRGVKKNKRLDPKAQAEQAYVLNKRNFLNFAVGVANNAPDSVAKSQATAKAELANQQQLLQQQVAAGEISEAQAQQNLTNFKQNMHFELANFEARVTKLATPISDFSNQYQQAIREDIIDSDKPEEAANYWAKVLKNSLKLKDFESVTAIHAAFGTLGVDENLSPEKRKQFKKLTSYIEKKHADVLTEVNNLMSGGSISIATYTTDPNAITQKKVSNDILNAKKSETSARASDWLKKMRSLLKNQDYHQALEIYRVVGMGEFGKLNAVKKSMDEFSKKHPDVVQQMQTLQANPPSANSIKTPVIPAVVSLTKRAAMIEGITISDENKESDLEFLAESRQGLYDNITNLSTTLKSAPEKSLASNNNLVRENSSRSSADTLKDSYQDLKNYQRKHRRRVVDIFSAEEKQIKNNEKRAEIAKDLSSPIKIRKPSRSKMNFRDMLKYTEDEAAYKELKNSRKATAKAEAKADAKYNSLKRNAVAASTYINARKKTLTGDAKNSYNKAQIADRVLKILNANTSYEQKSKAVDAYIKQLSNFEVKGGNRIDVLAKFPKLAAKLLTLQEQLAIHVSNNKQVKEDKTNLTSTSNDNVQFEEEQPSTITADAFAVLSSKFISHELNSSGDLDLSVSTPRGDENSPRISNNTNEKQLSDEERLAKTTEKMNSLFEATDKELQAKAPEPVARKTSAQFLKARNFWEEKARSKENLIQMGAPGSLNETDIKRDRSNTVFVGNVPKTYNGKQFSEAKTQEKTRTIMPKVDLSKAKALQQKNLNSPRINVQATSPRTPLSPREKHSPTRQDLQTQGVVRTKSRQFEELIGQTKVSKKDSKPNLNVTETHKVKDSPRGLGADGAAGRSRSNTASEQTVDEPKSNSPRPK